MGLPRKSKIISFLLIISLCFTVSGNYSYAGMQHKTVTICGFPIGLKLEGDGVTVTGFMSSSGRETGLKIGDRIIAINGSKVRNCSDLQELVNKKEQDYINVEIIPLEKKQSEIIKIFPSYDSMSHSYRLGVWVKDTVAGIGTMTFFDNEEGCFAALGHAISDNGCVYEISGGSLQEVTIFDIEKSLAGRPGELNGYFSDVNTQIGEIKLNSNCGLYGFLDISKIEDFSLMKAEIGNKNDVHTGTAYLITSLGEENIKQYEIKITSINKVKGDGTKALSICVTDNELIEKTGGIVQGMSGSPIMQDGKLIGAVTHVLIEDPTKGYGIFAENMLNTVDQISNKELKKAS